MRNPGLHWNFGYNFIMSLMRHVSLVLAASLALANDASAQDRAREALDQMIGTLGGEAFLNVRNIHTEGRFFQFTRGELSGIQLFADYIQFPDKERTEFGKDRDSAVVNSGNEGWIIADKKVEAQTPDQVGSFQEGFRAELDYLLRFHLGHPDTTVQYLGRKIINFSRTDVLEVRDPDKTQIRLYIDRQSHLPVRKEVRRLGSPKVEEEVYSNFHEFQGVTTPLLLSRYTDGVKTMEIHIESVRYNSNLPEALFTARLTR